MRLPLLSVQHSFWRTDTFPSKLIHNCRWMSFEAKMYFDFGYSDSNSSNHDSSNHDSSNHDSSNYDFSISHDFNSPNEQDIESQMIEYQVGFLKCYNIVLLKTVVLKNVLWTTIAMFCKIDLISPSIVIVEDSNLLNCQI